MKKINLISCLLTFHITIIFGQVNHKLAIDFKEIKVNTREVIGDALINIQVDSCKNIIFCKLPFNLSNSSQVIIEPGGTGNKIWINPSQKSNLDNSLLIECLSEKSNVETSIKNISLHIQNTTKNKSGKLIEIGLTNKSILNLAKYELSHLSEIEISGGFISVPESTYDGNDKSGKRYIIKFDDIKNNKKSIFIHLDESNDSSIFYFALVLLGILIGITTAPSFIKSLKSGISFLIISILGLTILGLFFSNTIEDEQKFSDTTTIVTFGTVFGILITVFVKSLIEIYKNIPKKDEQVNRSDLININESTIKINLDEDEDENDNEPEDQ